eukprot:jgi/Mesvir1/7340/Mv19149-RA.1
MVWFQCEDCGDMIKKPKLLGHFNRCSAGKLSCVDCGAHFNQQSVQEHKTCISEFDKYGFKDESGAPLGFSGSKKAATKGNAVSDERLGLSTQPPWKCSLCNVSATSLETLDGHAAGKKHQSKLRAALKARVPAEAPAAAAMPAQEAAKGIPENGHDASGGAANGADPQGAAPANASRNANGAEPANGAKEDPDSKKKKKKKNKGEEEGKQTETAVEEGKKLNKEAAEAKGVAPAEADTKQKTKKRKGEAAGGEGQSAEGETAAAGDGGGIAWKSWLKRTLKEAPGQQLTVKALKKAAWEAAQEQDGSLGDDSKKRVLQEMMGVVTKNSSSFSVDGDTVSKI